MTAVQRFAKEIRSRLLAERRRISQASHMVRPAIRGRDQAEMLGDYVRRGDSLLDVGCGTGYLSKCLEEMHGAEPTGLDVKDFRAAPISLRSFDGNIDSIPGTNL